MRILSITLLIVGSFDLTASSGRPYHSLALSSQALTFTGIMNEAGPSGMGTLAKKGASRWLLSCLTAML